MLRICCSLAACIVIAYGGVKDLRSREIPDLVPAVLLLCGLLLPQRIPRLISLLATVPVIALTRQAGGGELPGGDVKLICALSFFLGAPGLFAILAAVLLEAAAVSLCGHRPLKRNIPLCTYVAPAFILLSASNLILGGNLK